MGEGELLDPSIKGIWLDQRNSSRHDSDAIDEAFAIAAGRDSGLANYSAMSRLVRLKQREGMELNDAQRDHSVRHMGPMYTPVPTREEREDAVLKTMRR